MGAQEADARGQAAPGSVAAADAELLTHLDQVDVDLTVELGRRRLSLDEALALGEQSVLALERVVGEPVEIRVNGRILARGEVVTVGDRFGVRLTEVLAADAEG